MKVGISGLISPSRGSTSTLNDICPSVKHTSRQIHILSSMIQSHYSKIANGIRFQGLDAQSTAYASMTAIHASPQHRGIPH